ncbi:hypothetical protein C1H46_024771 [Malus baccata]|uniref:Formyl transferase N-terminal domain-containing protein n=1 Tax=Malus baccata TaxID=106549 RepID=A0A540LTA2_MALBA|nr:hypothetical protein C1H46_024771 [Malus baccata]
MNSSLVFRRFWCFSAATSSSSSSSSSTLCFASNKKPLVFLGFPQVLATVLDALLNASTAADSLFEIAAIVTQPPSRKSRGKKLMPSPLAQHALDRGFPSNLIFTPERAGEDVFLSDLRALQPQLCITAAYGNILPTKFLNIPTLASRSYARGGHKPYDLFGNGKPGDKEFREAWKKEIDEDDTLWTGREDESDNEKDEKSRLEKEIRKVRQQAREHSDLIDADDSDELRSVWSGSDEEKSLWTGSEDDDDDDIPIEAYPNESSDKHIDKLFEFEETSKYRTISELLKAEQEPEELSPGKQARKIAVENALKKLKKGPDGRYINVWEVMSDLDILVGAFENIVSGPEYAELRQGGPKKLNMQFFKDIQTRMRDPNYKFSPELKLKPKSKLVARKKWQKVQSRRRKAQKR